MSGALDPFFLDDPDKLDDPFSDPAWLREHRPVYHHEPVDQWFVFRYDDVRSLFSDARLSAGRMSGFADASAIEALHAPIERAATELLEA